MIVLWIDIRNSTTLLLVLDFQVRDTRTSYNKSVHKLLTSCVLTACSHCCCSKCFPTNSETFSLRKQCFLVCPHAFSTINILCTISNVQAVTRAILFLYELIFQFSRKCFLVCPHMKKTLIGSSVCASAFPGFHRSLGQFYCICPM